MKLTIKNLSHILIKGAMVCVLAMQVGNAQAKQVAGPAEQNQITAIDIALEPDATMVQHA